MLSKIHERACPSTTKLDCTMRYWTVPGASATHTKTRWPARLVSALMADKMEVLRRCGKVWERCNTSTQGRCCFRGSWVIIRSGRPRQKVMDQGAGSAFAGNRWSSG